MARQVQIDWSRACSWADFPEAAQEMGIYQITRDWAGVPALLYLGIVWSDGRTFHKRMQEHRRAWLGEMRGIRFRFGTVRPGRGLTRSRELIEEIEGALVCELNPRENTCKMQSYSIRHDLVIRSFGDRGFVPRLLDTGNHVYA